MTRATTPQDLVITLLGTYVCYVARVIRQGPEEGPVGEPATPAMRPRSLAGLGPRPQEGTA